MLVKSQSGRQGTPVDFVASPNPQCGFTHSLFLFNAVVPGEDSNPFLSFHFLFHIYIPGIISGTL